MLDDGLSVCLPDDPSGNAKLMFSILECLPKINRCTVFYIMDHLKLVISHGERNKMSSQSLATIFGPLFTCHSESETLHKPIEVFKFLLEIWPVRRVSTSRSGSVDLTIAKSLSSSTQQQHQQVTATSSSFIPHTITSFAHPQIIPQQQTGTLTTLTTTSSVSSSLPQPSHPPQTTSNSMLPMPSTLTPGPSPTALVRESTPTPTPITITTSTTTTTTTMISVTSNQESYPKKSIETYSTSVQQQHHQQQHHQQYQQQQFQQQQQYQQQPTKKTVAWGTITTTNNNSTARKESDPCYTSSGNSSMSMSIGQGIGFQSSSSTRTLPDPPC